MSGMFVPLFGPVPGGPEMIVILLIAILLFGANKIPKLARSTGEAMGEFKKGRQEVEEELQELQEGGAEEETVMSESAPDSGTESTAESGGSSETTTETETSSN